MADKNPFVYVMPSPGSISTISAIRAAMQVLHDAALELIPNCRERSVGLTKLEESSMWLNKAIVFSQPDPAVGP